MFNRREFLTQVGAAGGALVLGAASADSRSADRPLNVLILGGTGHIGPYHVRAAVARGHKVAVFSRGKTHADLPSTVERLVGDRNKDLESLKNRDWDAVMDLATYGPAWVRSLGEALKGRVKHYTFISTVSVYDLSAGSPPISEKHAVLEYKGKQDPYALTQHHGEHYGALKVLCEREAERQFPGRTLILRPGYIGGPDDTHDILVYWPLRAEKGAEMLAAGDPSTPVQFIDVRDMAEWAIRLIEANTTGVFNTIGPVTPITLRHVVDAACKVVATTPKVTWIPKEWLVKQKNSELWGTLLFWEHNQRALASLSNERAVAHGLTTRPLDATLADTLRWYKRKPADYQTQVNVGFRRKPDGSGYERNMMSWASYLEREKETLTAWHAQQSNIMRAASANLDSPAHALS